MMNGWMDGWMRHIIMSFLYGCWQAVKVSGQTNETHWPLGKSARFGGGHKSTTNSQHDLLAYQIEGFPKNRSVGNWQAEPVTCAGREVLSFTRTVKMCAGSNCKCPFSCGLLRCWFMRIRCLSYWSSWTMSYRTMLESVLGSNTVSGNSEGRHRKKMKGWISVLKTRLAKNPAEIPWIGAPSTE